MGAREASSVLAQKAAPSLSSRAPLAMALTAVRFAAVDRRLGRVRAWLLDNLGATPGPVVTDLWRCADAPTTHLAPAGLVPLSLGAARRRLIAGAHSQRPS